MGFVLKDAINSLAFRHKDIPARVSDIKDDAQDAVVMSRADPVRNYGRGLAVSESGPDETVQHPCPPPLSTVNSTSTAPYMRSGTGSSSGRASTSAGGVWAERRRHRIQSNKHPSGPCSPLKTSTMRVRFGVSSRDRMSWSGRRRIMRARMRCAPVGAVGAGIASSTKRPVTRREEAKTIAVSSLSTSYHAHSHPLPKHAAAS